MSDTRSDLLCRMKEKVFQKYHPEWGTLLLETIAAKHDIRESTFSEFIAAIDWGELGVDDLNAISKGIGDLYNEIRVCMRLLKNGKELVNEEALISEIRGIWEEYHPQWVSKEMVDNIPKVAFRDYKNLGDYVRRVPWGILHGSDSTEFLQMYTFWNRAVSLLRRMEVVFIQQVKERRVALVMSLHGRLGGAASIRVLREDLVGLLCDFV